MTETLFLAGVEPANSSNQNTKTKNRMKTKTADAPLDWEEAQQLNETINAASKNRQVLTIDPETGVEGTSSGGMISSPDRLNGLSRFGTHYQN